MDYDKDEENQDLKDAENKEFIGNDEEDKPFEEEIEQAEIDELLAKQAEHETDRNNADNDDEMQDDQEQDQDESEDEVNSITKDDNTGDDVDSEYQDQDLDKVSEEQATNDESTQDEATTELHQSTRETKTVERLKPSMKGKSYLQVACKGIEKQVGNHFKNLVTFVMTQDLKS